MSSMDATIWVKIEMPGFHNWPDAASNRDYLSSRHRHLFHVTARVPVAHDDRDIEFHDLMDAMRAYWPKGGEWGGMSCEAIARNYAGMLLSVFLIEWAEVGVSEDGEAGATLRMHRE